MEVLFAQIGNESGEDRESLGIDGEWSILVLEVDVEVEHAGRNLVGAETVGDLPSLGFRSVAVARLLEAKRTQRRKWRHSGEISVAFHDLFRRGAIEKIIVERAAFGAEGNRVARLLAEVKPRAPGVVEEHAITAGAADCEEERNAFVERVDRFLGTDVGVPERIGLIPAVEGTSLVAEAKIMLVGRHLLGNGETIELEFHVAAHGVGGDDVAREIANDR